MPGQDRTGPMGYGPRTGRILGPCGRGFARGFGRGVSMRFGYAYQPTKEQETADLNAEKEFLKQELDDITARLKELENKK